MKLAYKHLLKFFDDNLLLEDISKKLFQLGHEHDIEDDIFNFELTPNRGDCLSLLGIARDLNVFFKTNLYFDIYEEKIEVLNLDFENLSPEHCPRISFLELEVEDVPSKYNDFLESYFDKLQITKNNFFTDISNYLSYELGQPTHCFDRSKIDGKITFESKICNTRFDTLLGDSINLKGENSIFTKDNEVISLAGVIGGKSTACSTETKKVLIECAYFNPESIIGKSIQYNLNSDAAHKFERGVDINCHEKVLRRFIKIVEQHSKVKSCKMVSFNSLEVKKKELSINLEKVNSILGTKIPKDEYESILEKLGFNLNTKIEVPTFRTDINSQNDIAEEIARVLGYDNIQSKSISIPSIEETNKKQNLEELKSHLKKNGFYEVINFPFTSLRNDDSISLDNPLDSNKRHLRVNLRESLTENLLYNERRQKDSIKLFEISDTYCQKNEIHQTTKLGIIVSGRLGHNHNDFSKKIDENLILVVLKDFFNSSDIVIEQLSRSNLDTKIKSNIFYAEIDLATTQFKDDQILGEKKNKIFKKYSPISEFPSSSRDFSFLISNYSKYNQVIKAIDSVEGIYLKESFIFDFYKNKKNKEIKIGVRMIFQSNEKTLSDEDINNSISEIIEPILLIDGVSVPGM
tara:strand:+ start:7666 stop:9564 length:1899 start_codon:yes stop_codon:yes gene_type:complete